MAYDPFTLYRADINAAVYSGTYEECRLALVKVRAGKVLGIPPDTDCYIAPTIADPRD